MLFNLTSDKDNGYDFTKKMSSTTNFDKGSYEVGLLSAMICYGWNNISASIGNNIIEYTTDGAITVNVVIPDGTYGIVALNNYMHKVMKDNLHYNAGEDTRPIATTDDTFYITLV